MPEHSVFRQRLDWGCAVTSLLEALAYILTTFGLLLVLALTVFTYAYGMVKCVNLCDWAFDRFKFQPRLDGFGNKAPRVKSMIIVSIIFSVATFYAVMLLNRTIEKAKSHAGTSGKISVQPAAGTSGNVPITNNANWLLRTQKPRFKKL